MRILFIKFHNYFWSTSQLNTSLNYVNTERHSMTWTCFGPNYVCVLKHKLNCYISKKYYMNRSFYVKTNSCNINTISMQLDKRSVTYKMYIIPRLLIYFFYTKFKNKPVHTNNNFYFTTFFTYTPHYVSLNGFYPPPGSGLETFTLRHAA